MLEFKVCTTVIVQLNGTNRIDCEQLTMQRKSGIEAKNEAETQIYSAEASVREYKDKLPQNVVDNINTEISNVRGSLESGDAEEIRSKVGVRTSFAALPS